MALKNPRRAAILALTLALAAPAFAGEHAPNSTPPPVGFNLPLDERPVPREGRPRTSFAPIVERVAPGVVKIETTATVTNSPTAQLPDLNDPFWQHFFGNQIPQSLTPHSPIRRHEHGLGSGVIVSKDGYILTNDHLVDGATDVTVTLPDRREFPAKVVGRDPKSDIAVVKVNADDLPFVPMADSEKVQVGDVVLALGNPFGVGETVTEGIVSGKDRGNMGIEDYEDFLQTDAAINPGNSGGALVDTEGRLIGINTAIISRSGGSVGLGFAIPSDLARKVMVSLIQYGHVTRGYLGVVIQDVTPPLAREFELQEPSGALVAEVAPNGPAAAGGIKEGDILLAFNNKPVTDSEQLKLTVAGVAPGATVPVEVWRNGKMKTLDVTIRELPGVRQVAEKPAQSKPETGTLNGVGVTDLDQEARQQYNVPSTVKGAIITEVKSDSSSAEAGLKPGEVIEEINHQPVRDAADAVRLTEHATDKHTLVRVWEKDGSHYVVVDESQTG
ncbi:MAG TPA: DegQ family serine endoprotease [Candidatus Acidoferrum sp.]|nr:DegQ family serine endoprotease [Candidatus Acidoferrum sp.]